MPKQELYLIGAMAIVTLLIRYPILAISSHIKLSSLSIEALKYLPPAILTAIVVPAVLIPSGEQILLNYTNARLVGAIAASRKLNDTVLVILLKKYLTNKRLKLPKFWSKIWFAKI